MKLTKPMSQAVGFKLNPIKLIRLVRRNDVLYNRDAEGYTDKNQKYLIWERIHKQLYPKYNSSNERIKQVIRNSVRRRWRTLRDNYAREVKRSATVENYTRKQDPTITELEFLKPYIKSAHCDKFTDGSGSRENNRITNETSDNNDEEDLGTATDCSSSQSVMVFSSPTVVMTSDTNGDADCNVPNNHGGKSTTVGNTVQNDEEINGHADEQAETSSSAKKRRTDDAKVECERNGVRFELLFADLDDKDRLFFLSLAAQFKDIPSLKKPLIKAELFKVVAQGFDH